MSTYSANIHSIPSTSTPPFRILAGLSQSNSQNANTTSSPHTSRTHPEEEDSSSSPSPMDPPTPTLDPLSTHSSTYSYIPPSPLPNWNYPPSTLPTQLQDPSHPTSTRETTSNPLGGKYLEEDRAITPQALDSPTYNLNGHPDSSGPRSPHTPPSNRASSILLSTIPEEHHGLLSGLNALTTPGHRYTYIPSSHPTTPSPRSSSSTGSGSGNGITCSGYGSINGTGFTNGRSHTTQTATPPQSQRNSTSHSTLPSTARTSLFNTSSTRASTSLDDTSPSPPSSAPSSRSGSPRSPSPYPHSRTHSNRGANSKKNTNTHPLPTFPPKQPPHPHPHLKPSLKPLKTKQSNTHTPTPTPEEETKALAAAEARAWAQRYDTAQPSGKALSVRDEEYIRLVTEFRRGMSEMERNGGGCFDVAGGGRGGGREMQGRKEKRGGMRRILGLIRGRS